MRKRFLPVMGVAVLLVLAALAAVATASATPAQTTLVPGCAKAKLDLVSSGKLTIGTDNPAYPPWFGGGELEGSKWQINDPSTGKGFESAVAYAVAKELGFSHDQVEWTYVPFNRAFAPGKKSFDFDINQISITPARAKVVTFSSPYYDQNQAIVVLKGTPISKVRTVAGLRKYKLGAQLGTTSYDYIKNRIRPTTSPAVYPQNAGAVQGLKNGQIDGLVVDLPTAFYVTAVQVPKGTILGQFPAVPGGEHFGMVFAKGNPLVTCVNRAIAKLKRNGTLQKIQQQWLAKATGAPVLR
jgi:polar amino acid transport system substrate-binding protein